MWPLVQSNDFCSFYPIQAVTEKQGTGILTKDASTIEVGDVVFCAPQPNYCFYAHLVLKKEWRRESGQYCYEIGNISGHVNGWCHREHDIKNEKAGPPQRPAKQSKQKRSQP